MKIHLFHLFHHLANKCWYWSVHHVISSNTKALYSGCTTTRAAARKQIAYYKRRPL